jgi:hypothetical protein
MPSNEDNKGKIINLFAEAAKRGKTMKAATPDISQKIVSGDGNKQVAAKKRTVKKATSVAQEIINGSNNTQIACDYSETHHHYNTVKPPDMKILPPADSIGGNALLKNGIQDRFKKLADARAKRFDDVYKFIYGRFKKVFGIPKEQKYTVYLTWPVECADSIIDYLDGLYANTIDGRIEKAASREGYIHEKPQLFKRERELLDCLGLKPDNAEVRQMLHNFFGVASHSKLDKLQLWQLVNYLEGLVKKQLGE